MPEDAPSPVVAAPVRPGLWQLFRYFASLGTTGFGGPIALVGYMEREFVDVRRWVTKQELKEGLAFAQLAPGPLAAQLAIYLGWLCAGTRGATVAGVAFVTPSFVMVVALAALYVPFGGLPWLQGAFYGIGAAVIAIVARSAVKLVRTTIGRDRLLWVCFALTALVTAWTERELAWLFVLCGVGVAAARIASPARAHLASSLAFLASTSPLVLAAGSTATLSTLFLFFASAGLFVFGSGLAIVPFLHGGVVVEHRWLTERQFLDAVAVALITPGPVVITVAFIGFLVAGVAGAAAAAVGVFAPVYLITVLLAPHYDRFKRDTRVRGFVDGVTAAATGAIAGAAFVLARRAIVDAPSAAIALVTFVCLVRLRRVPEPLVVLSAGVVGILLKTVWAR